MPDSLALIPMSPAFLSERDAARYVAMSIHFLRQNRQRGCGPSYVRLGRAIRYRVLDLEAWLKRSTIKTTSR